MNLEVFKNLSHYLCLIYSNNNAKFGPRGKICAIIFWSENFFLNPISKRRFSFYFFTTFNLKFVLHLNFDVAATDSGAAVSVCQCADGAEKSELICSLNLTHTNTHIFSWIRQFVAKHANLFWSYFVCVVSNQASKTGLHLIEHKIKIIMATTKWSSGHL